MKEKTVIISLSVIVVLSISLNVILFKKFIDGSFKQHEMISNITQTEQEALTFLNEGNVSKTKEILSASIRDKLFSIYNCNDMNCLNSKGQKIDPSKP